MRGHCVLRRLREPRALLRSIALLVGTMVVGSFSGDLGVGPHCALLAAGEFAEDGSVAAESTDELSPGDGDGRVAPANRLASVGTARANNGGRIAAAAEAASPALYSRSLPLSRLAEMPPRAPLTVREPVRGLDWMRFESSTSDPRGGRFAVHFPEVTLPDFFRLPEVVASTTSDTIADTVALEVPVLPQEFSDSDDRSSLHRPELRLFDTPTIPSGISPALLALEAERSELLRSLRPSQRPSGESHHDIFRPSPPETNLVYDALSALGQKIAFRELRRYFRQELKDQFEEDPSFRHEDYLERRRIIGQLGRGGRAEDLVIEERTTEIRNEFLDASPEDPERDVPLIQWGPLVLDDRGGVNVDVLQLRETPSFREFGLAASDAPVLGRGYGESVLFPNERYRVRSKMKLNPDLREIGRDWEEAFGKLSASVEIDWRAPVLTHKSFSTEVGGSIDAGGRFGVYLNLVIYGK